MRRRPRRSRRRRRRGRRAADHAELGYRPDPTAQLLRRRRSRLLGVVFSARDPFHADLLDAIYPAARQAGHDVVLSAVAATRTESEAVEALLESRCEAVILLGPTADADRLAVLGRRLSVVAVGAAVAGAPVDTVRTADADGARLAVDHLVALGHRHICHVDGADHPGAAERRRGYRDAMAHHALDAHIRVVPGDDTEATGARAAALLLGSDDLTTAVVAYNDRCATGVLDTLRRSRVDVPGTVSVVGYDDSQLSRLSHVDLTTVRQDAAGMAELAVRAAVERLETGDPPREMLFHPQLVVRSTSGPPPSADPADRSRTQ